MNEPTRCPTWSDEAVRAAACASGFVDEGEAPDAMLLRGVRKMLDAAGRFDGDRYLSDKIAALTVDQIVELTESWTDRDGCFIGGFHEWRVALVAALVTEKGETQ